MLVAFELVAVKYEAVGAEVAVRVFPVSQEVSIPADPPETDWAVLQTEPVMNTSPLAVASRHPAVVVDNANFVV